MEKIDLDENVNSFSVIVFKIWLIVRGALPPRVLGKIKDYSHIYSPKNFKGAVHVQSLFHLPHLKESYKNRKIEKVWSSLPSLLMQNKKKRQKTFTTYVLMSQRYSSGQFLLFFQVSQV